MCLRLSAIEVLTYNLEQSLLAGILFIYTCSLYLLVISQRLMVFLYPSDLEFLGSTIILGSKIDYAN